MNAGHTFFVASGEPRAEAQSAITSYAQKKTFEPAIQKKRSKNGFLSQIVYKNKGKQMKIIKSYEMKNCHRNK